LGSGGGDSLDGRVDREGIGCGKERCKTVGRSSGIGRVVICLGSEGSEGGVVGQVGGEERKSNENDVKFGHDYKLILEEVNFKARQYNLQN